MPVKEVQVTTEMGEGTKIECRAGDHTFIIDQSKAAGGQDLGPTPLEYYLVSIAGCISSIARIVARQKKIDLKGMRIETSGSLNTDVLQGKVSSERSGFQEIFLRVSMDTDLSPSQQLEFLEEVERRCPVSENTTNPTKVSLKLI